MKIENVLVAGGYGTIGQTVCQRLDAWGPGDVVVAGRTPGKARRFAATAAAFRPARLDVGDPSTFDAALDGVDAAVVCLDAKEPAFAEACLRRGVHYVDISPTDALLRRIEDFDDLARAQGATALLSVGLSPGITNLFVREAARRLDAVQRADITLGLGLGEAFGPDTIAWTVDEALRPFTLREGGPRRRVRGFSEPRIVDLAGWGPRRAYRANLADQHVLQRTTSIPIVATRLCYDVRWITAAIALLQRLRLFRPVASALGPKRLAGCMGALPFGADASVIQTEVTGMRADRSVTQVRWVQGTDQARATAHVAAAAVRYMQRTPMPAGVHHLHQQCAIGPFLDALRKAGWNDGARTQPVRGTP